MIRKSLLFIAASLLTTSAFADATDASKAAVFKGRCTVLQQPVNDIPFKVLANKEIALAPGKTKTIYKYGGVKYQITLIAHEAPNAVTLYTLDALITYGAPKFLGSGQASFDSRSVAAGTIPGVGVDVKGLPTFGCDANPPN